jgi:hypothetical protein
MLRYLNDDNREMLLRSQGDRCKMMIEELQKKVYTELSL